MPIVKAGFVQLCFNRNLEMSNCLVIFFARLRLKHFTLALILKKTEMIIKRLKTKNYRSLEDLEVTFNPHYNALSGKNNSGKSNIIRALLTFLTYDFRVFREYYMSDIHFASDYPYWKKKEKE